MKLLVKYENSGFYQILHCKRHKVGTETNSAKGDDWRNCVKQRGIYFLL